MERSAAAARESGHLRIGEFDLKLSEWRQHRVTRSCLRRVLDGAMVAMLAFCRNENGGKEEIRLRRAIGLSGAFGVSVVLKLHSISDMDSILLRWERRAETHRLTD